MMTGVLLNRQAITINRPSRAVDEHGWAVLDSDLTQIAAVRGSVQRSQPVTDNSMTKRGQGPYHPSVVRQARAYLPPDCGVVPGDVLTTSGWPTVVVKSCELIHDPRDSGELDCIVAVVEEVPQNG